MFSYNLLVSGTLENRTIFVYDNDYDLGDNVVVSRLTDVKVENVVSLQDIEVGARFPIYENDFYGEFEFVAEKLCHSDQWVEEEEPDLADNQEQDDDYEHYFFTATVLGRHKVPSSLCVKRSFDLNTPLFLFVPKQKKDLTERRRFDVHDGPYIRLESNLYYNVVKQKKVSPDLTTNAVVQLTQRPAYLPGDTLECTGAGKKYVLKLPEMYWWYDRYVYKQLVSYSARENHFNVKSFFAHHKALELSFLLVAHLPPYVLLEIARFLPWFESCTEQRFIQTCAGVQKSLNRLSQAPMAPSAQAAPITQNPQTKQIYALTTHVDHIFICFDPLVKISDNIYHNLRDKSTVRASAISANQKIVLLPATPQYVTGDEVWRNNIKHVVQLSWHTDHFEYGF